MTVQASPSCLPYDPSKDTFPTPSSPQGHCREVFPPSLLCHWIDLPQGQRWGAPKTAAKTGDCTYHGQEGAFLEAGVEGDELGLRAALTPQETTAGERKSHSYSTTVGQYLVIPPKHSAFRVACG